MQCPYCSNINKISDIKRWYVGPEYFCPSCGEYVFSIYQGRKFLPGDIILKKWNPKNHQELYKIDQKINFFEVKNKKDIFQLRALQYLGQRDGAFIPSSLNSLKSASAIILLSEDSPESVGFLKWIPKKFMLGQIFIHEKYRRQGLASKLFLTWIETYCKEAQEIIIGSPNIKVYSMILKYKNNINKKILTIGPTGLS